MSKNTNSGNGKETQNGGDPDLYDKTESSVLETIENDGSTLLGLETIETANENENAPYPYPTSSTAADNKEEKDEIKIVSATTSPKAHTTTTAAKEDDEDTPGRKMDDAHKEENPTQAVIETIDPQEAFPDPPVYDTNASIKTWNQNNPTNQHRDNDGDQNNNGITRNITNDNNNHKNDDVYDNNNDNKLSSDKRINVDDSDDNKNENSVVDSLNNKNDKTDSGTNLTYNDRHDSEIATQSGHHSPSRLHQRGISVQRNQNLSRATSIPKPKSSLREPIYKYQREEFLDQQMLISYTKLDGLLFRLFSRHGRRQLGPEEKPLTFVEDGKSDVISMDPVTWNLRPMSAVQKETLDSEIEFLEETLCPKQVVRRLFLDGVLTHMDYNQITRTEGQGEKAQVRLLVGTLKRRGEKAYPNLIKVLRDLDLQRIWERLEATQRSLNDGVIEDQRKSERRLQMTRLNSSTNTTTNNSKPIRPSESDYNEEILRRFLQSAFDNASMNNDINNNNSNSNNHNSNNPSRAFTDELRLRLAPSNPQDSSQERQLKSDQLEKQLGEINVELKALHENLNLLQTARSTTRSTGARQSSQGDPTSSASQASVNAKDTNLNQPATAKEDNQANATSNQKSKTCTLL